MHEELLRAALEGLGLAPGAGWSEVLTRYRQLAKVWHPDKFKSHADKAHAEEKLKKIIAAKEMLQAHYFSDNHRSRGWCICWGRASPPPITTETTRAPQAQASPTAPPTPTSTPAAPPPQPPPRPPEQPPPPKPPPTTPDPQPEPDKEGDKKESDSPKGADSGWDWRNEFSQYLDLGPLEKGEPPWLETFRRACEKVTGKHPGDTIEDIWSKAPVSTKEHKRKCLLLVIFAVMAIDKLITAIDPDAFKSPEQLAHPELSQPGKPSLPLSPFPELRKPDFGPPVDFDSPDEIRKDEQYFERKWQEKEEMLQRIRPGYKPNP